MSTLACTGIDYVRGGRTVLDGVAMQAWSGSSLAVTGPSGSGKSSLLSILALLEHPDAGQVVLDGETVTPNRRDLRTRFGLVLQGYGLVAMLTAAENVELVLQAAGREREETRERAERLLAAVGMTDQADQLIDQLSGGQQQRVAVARALATDPKIVIADEPTAALDAESRDLVLDLLFDAVRRGALVILATHDREIADRCDAEVAMADGVVVATDGVATDGVATDGVSSAEGSRAGGAHRMPTAATHHGSATQNGSGPNGSARTGRRKRAAAASPPPGPARRLSGEGLTWSLGSRRVLDGVDVTAAAGEVLAVTGPSGSGKSTLLALLAGLQQPQAGRVLIDGVPLGADPLTRRRFGLVLQGYGLLSVLTVAESVELILQQGGAERGRARAEVAELLARLGLEGRADSLVDQLSGGQQQRLAVARALIGRPEIVLADEPTAELDAETRELVVAMLVEQAGRGAIVVIATHDPEVAQRCDRRVHLIDGRVVDGRVVDGRVVSGTAASASTS